MKKTSMIFTLIFITSYVVAETSESHKTPLIQETGYVLVMELVFTGMSCLSASELKWGSEITGTTDLAFALSSFWQAGNSEGITGSEGFWLLGAGFLGKALINYTLDEKLESSTLFLVNFILYNVLIFSGYFITDYLN